MTFNTSQKKEVAFAFDLDGTLIDTEKDKAASHHRTVAYFGGDTPKNLYYQFIGNSFEFVFESFKKHAHLEVSLEEYHDKFNEFYLQELGRNLQPEVGVVDILDSIIEQGYKIALVTSSERWMVDLILRKININEYFDVIITGDDVILGKPDPECYSLAIDKLGSKLTFAFEDTIPGIQSAKSAGASVIAIKNNYNQHLDLTDTVMIISKWTDFNLNSLIEIK